MFKEPISMLEEFEIKLSDSLPKRPLYPDEKEIHLRYNLMLEELKEWREAALNRSMSGMLDGLADVMYLLLGTIVRHGFQFKDIFSKVFEVVHESNMDKFRDPIKRREDGKILKPDGWESPERRILEILRTELQEQL